MANQPALPERSGALYRQSHDIQPAQLPAKVQKGIDREGAWGLIQAARAQAVAFVVEGRIEATELVVTRAMLGLDRIHRVEAALSREDPIQAARYDSLVDVYLSTVRGVVNQMPREF